MPSPVEAAVDNYIRAWSERDPGARLSLLEACFATDGRIVQRSGETRGRAALAEMIEKFFADPQWLGVRITSAIDAVGTTSVSAPLSIATTVRLSSSSTLARLTRRGASS